MIPYSNIYIFLFLCGLVFGTPAYAGECSEKKAATAEMASVSPKNWKELFAVYDEYSSCDSGAISEGFSDTVAKLMSSPDPKMADLNKIVSASSSFKVFVVNHLDELMSSHQAKEIILMAKKKCPLEAYALCSAILSRMEKLKTETKS